MANLKRNVVVTENKQFQIYQIYLFLSAHSTAVQFKSKFYVKETDVTETALNFLVGLFVSSKACFRVGTSGT